MKKIPFLHLVLFILTFGTTLVVGALYAGANIFDEPMLIYKGLPFSSALLLILLTHEFSHYIASKKHKVKATLPYFIPAPTLFGTFGAVIKMKSPITTKNALMDIGASGPIAGFVVSLIAAVIGLRYSEVVQMTMSEGSMIFGDSLMFIGLTKLIIGTVPENYDVLLHPIGIAGWIGFFVTALNLLPIGQLDGGHIAYALLGKRHTSLSVVLIGFMTIFGLVHFTGWLFLAFLMLILGFRHPPIIYSEIPLDRKRKIIGWVALVIFIVTFTPVPIKIL
jgi:membrane-associated protease RseP (regulator of RpoE activity)